MTRVYFETRSYELANTRKPRGFGSWAFSFVGRDPADTSDPAQVFWAHTSKYSDAKKAAAKAARARGVSTLWVLS